MLNISLNSDKELNVITVSVPSTGFPMGGMPMMPIVNEALLRDVCFPHPCPLMCGSKKKCCKKYKKKGKKACKKCPIQ